MTPWTPEPGAQQQQALRPQLSFLGTLRSVAWGFFGVRKSSEHERDLSLVNPIHLVVAGVLGALLLVLLLIVLVRWVVASGAAT